MGIVDNNVKNSAIYDYLTGMSYRAVGNKYNVDHKSVRYWVLNSGNKSRDRTEALILAGEKLRGHRRSICSEFKKGTSPWNKNTKGVIKANSTSFKKGQHASPGTEFTKGQHVGSLNPSWRGGRSSYTIEFNNDLKALIRYRDGYRCFICKDPQTEGGKLLDCHHIDYNKKVAKIKI